MVDTEANTTGAPAEGVVPVQPVETKPRKPRRLLLKAFVTFVLLAFAVALAVVVAGVAVYQHVTQPGVPGEPVNITIPPGAAGRDAAQILANAGLIEHEAFFRIALRLDETRRPIKFGRYSIAHGQSPLEMLHLLQDGPNRPPDPADIPPELRPTIPEGLTIAQMAQLFANPQAFVDAASDPALLATLDLKTPTLEGFLLPNTYFFEKQPTERQVVERMVEEFKKQYEALTAEVPPPTGFNLREIVTIASLVEEEARVPEERPDVAAVIYNRLKRRMPLQLDSTLQYILNKYGQRLLYEDREVDSPYNTYKNPGLPPGPISAPGIQSLKAALRPSQTNYLYFVSNADGKTHTFSDTMTEHTKAVNKFRKEIAPQRKAKAKEKAETGKKDAQKKQE